LSWLWNFWHDTLRVDDSKSESLCSTDSIRKTNQEQGTMTARIAALEEPFDAAEGAVLATMMPTGIPPIALFRTFARNLAMTSAMRTWGGYELSRNLSLSLRDREIVIDRTCARCDCEYEWGIHIAFFADRAGLTGAQVSSLTVGSTTDTCWEIPRDRLLIETVDALHDESDIDDELWERLSATFDEPQLIDLIMLSGWYHAISFGARALRVPLEPGAPRFSDYRLAGP
jgi:alkylhydroperoxidase family enzyme